MMQIDFINDLAGLYIDHFLSKKCAKENYDNPTPEKIIFDFIKMHHRSLKRVPRNIKSCKDFVTPNEVHDGLVLLEKCVKRGESLVPFLSKLSINADSNDMMLNDWGIYHFHLGKDFEDSGFIKRTGPLLYGFVTDECLYKICIANHGEWNSIKLLDAINREWPNLLNTFHSTLENSNYKINSDKEVEEQRNSFLNYQLQLSDGTILTQIGGGFSINGTSEYVTDTFIYIKHELQRLEQISVNHFQQSCNSSSKITLCVNDSDLCAICDNNQTAPLTLKVHDKLRYLFNFWNSNIDFIQPKLDILKS